MPCRVMDGPTVQHDCMRERDLSVRSKRSSRQRPCGVDDEDKGGGGVCPVHMPPIS